MAKSKSKSKKKVPVRLAVSNDKIICTGCPAPSSVAASKSNVFVKGKPILTAKDIDLKLNVQPFSTCTLNPLKKCVFNSCSLWGTKIENVESTKNKPLTEKDTLKCDAQGGKISFLGETQCTPEPPPNVIDQAQSKINNTVNGVTKKAADLTKSAGEAIDSVGETVKKAGGFIKNENVQSAIKGASDFVDNVDLQKAKLDVKVANYNIKLENLRLQLKQLLTGEQQKFKKEFEVDENKGTPGKETKQEEKKEVSLNSEIFDTETQRSVDELFRVLSNPDMVTLAVGSKSFSIGKKELPSKYTPEDNKQKKSTENDQSAQGISRDDIVQEPSILGTLRDVSGDYANRGGSNFTEYSDLVRSYNEDVSLQGPSDSKKALGVMHLLDDLMNGNGPSIDINSSSLTPRINIPSGDTISGAIVGAGTLQIAETRSELNDKVQGKINDLLKEIEYFEKLAKYKKKSAEAQEDIDNAAAALDLVGDFDAFIDGIVSKELGEIAVKAKEKLAKLNNNMTQLNTGMDGMSYAAGGFAKGDVFTHVEAEAEEGEKDDDDSGITAQNLSTAGLFGDNSSVTDDRNEEAKILRMFVIWDQDYEDYKAGELVTLETIPPDIKVCLVIQSNKKANGEVVSVDLGDRSTHYEYDGGHQCTITRTGLFEDIVLNGDSPNFEAGGGYDLNDPDYALEGSNRRKLNDKTKIRFTSILPDEEEEELF